MTGDLTRSLGGISFQRHHPRLWGMLFICPGQEKKARAVLARLGIPFYMPSFFVHGQDSGANGPRCSRRYQGVAFACWDAHDHPGLCSVRNGFRRNEVHHFYTEDGVLRSMEAFTKLELISERHPVELFESFESFEPCTLNRGALAGTSGYAMRDGASSVFLLPLDRPGSYAKIRLPQEDF